MGQMIGYLRENRATHGEKLVLKRLRTALPNDFYVYVECPLQDRRTQRFPDFIIVCNFGVVVLEVKDWVHIVEANKYNAKIRRRDGEITDKRNPVLDAKGYAELLADALQTIPDLLRDNRKLDVPWGYAAVLPNLHVSVVTQLRTVWGEKYVLSVSDLQPRLVTKRLKATLPYDRALRRHEIQCIRGVINPTIRVVPEERDKPAIPVPATLATSATLPVGTAMYNTL